MNKDFQQLGISQRWADKLRRQSIVTPTDIQQQAIPHVLKGRDLIGQAQTGTGKTLAFLLPILEKMHHNKQELQALILSPTRELAMQIVRELRALNEESLFDVLAVVGGTDIERQIQKLQRQAQIIVATPGRLVDLILRKKVNLHTAKTLVIDEADQMIEMGFVEDVERITRHIRKDRQTLLFSATFPPRIRKLTEDLMRNPLHIHVNQNLQTVPEIELHYMLVKERSRDELFAQLLQAYNPYLAIIFANTRDQADLLTQALVRRGLLVDVLHGDLQQWQRKQVLQKFREAKIQYLVASDLAARGLDIEGVTHVFNYEFPRDLSWFIHRIGRTGRAGETGIATTLFTDQDLFKLAKVEKALGRRMRQVEVVNGEVQQKVRKQGTAGTSSRGGQLVTEDGEVWSTRKPRQPKKKSLGAGSGKSASTRSGSVAGVQVRGQSPKSRESQSQAPKSQAPKSRVPKKGVERASGSQPANRNQNTNKSQVQNQRSAGPRFGSKAAGKRPKR